jgi:hypothetical protein
MAAGWVAKESSVMALARCGWLVALLASIGDGVEFSIHCLDRQFDAAVGVVHFLLAILADVHDILTSGAKAPCC